MSQSQQPPAKRPRQGPAPSGNSTGGDAETAKRGLIAVNNLRYELAPDLSVVVSRTMHSQVFHTSEYTPDQRMVCQWNSGSSYIDPQNSYLEFELEVTHSKLSRVTFGSGSATSLFADVSINSRSGDEIERTENVWNIMPEQDRMHRPSDWFNSVGALAGYNTNGDDMRQYYRYTAHAVDATIAHGDEQLTVSSTGAPAGRASAYFTPVDANICGYGRHDVNGRLISDNLAPAYATSASAHANLIEDAYSGGIFSTIANTTVTTTKKFIIPLSSISQFFRTTDKLIPSALASGLRVELQLNSKFLPFVAYDATDSLIVDNAVTFKIMSPRMLLDCYQLTDSIQRAMNETIASSGIEMPFVASYYTGYQTATNTSTFNIEIRKAVSRALTVVTKPTWKRATTSTILDAHTTPHVKSLVGMGFNLTSYQVRVGSLHFPHQPLTNAVPGRLLKDLYHHTMRSGAAAFKRPNAPGCLAFSRFGYDGTVIWTDLERSSVQNLTGIPINNSRVVELQLKTKDQSLNEGMEIQTYLFYVRLVRVFLNNVEIEE